MGSTPNFSAYSNDFHFESWLKKQDWYDEKKEYIMVLDSEWFNYDIEELL